MTENIENQPNAQPQAGENAKQTELKETIPDAEDKEILIPVKFNKEIKNLRIEDAGILAQKGMKYDLISNEYESLRKLAKQNGKSVCEFLNVLAQRQINDKKSELMEKCGGNEELANHILELENGISKDEETGFDEIKKYFPEIKKISDLPESVVESAELKGTLLLDEYLRYKLDCRQESDSAVIRQNIVNASSIGSQADCRSGLNPEASEFLKGLWK